MIVHVQPVAHMPAVPVDRQRASLEPVQHHQRDQLFRELIRPVVVRTIGDEDGQPVGVKIGPHEMVGRCLARRVRRVGRVRRLFAELAARPERAVHFVGRHVQEAKPLALGRRERGDELPRRLQKDERADDVRFDEGARAVDGAVDVRLGRQIQDRVGPLLGEYASHHGPIGNIRPHEADAGIFERLFEVQQAARVGEFVDDDETVGGVNERVLDEVRPDETCATGDEESGHAIYNLQFTIDKENMRWPSFVNCQL